MSREANPQGDLFISLEPTREEEQDWGGRYQYQVATLGNIIEEFGFDREVIVSIPTLVRLHLTINNGTTPYHRTAPRVRENTAGEILTLDYCLHLGYVTDFIIIRGVQQQSTFDRKFRHQWQPTSDSVTTFVQHINN
jgi:hypothetical protein